MACELGRVGIETTLIPDSSIFAMMARTNKVIIQTETAFASGTILARSGVKNLAMSAKHHSVTVVVLLELFKLSPKNIQEFNFPRELSDPKDIFPHSNPLVERIIVENPKYDLISSEYVDLFVTSLGGFTASGLYRILDELYNKEDIK
ncbi:Translation initiation factor eIF-2B subunit beta [Bonamia ostreae]|uniref:Translation initiation factor eIF2B subunit beta n=1 Tax=Bonamia ostreae TaxID=126728 RepID=A0ABV2AN11_9EUKA